jgi:hypothetical protein
MIINGIWISLMIHVYSRGTFIIELQTLMSYSLCFCDTCNIRDLIVGISISSSILLPTLPFTRSVILHPPGLVTCCNIGWNLTSGPRVSFCHVEEQIPLLMHTPQHTPLETQRHILSHPVKVETVDAIKASSRSSD